MRRDPLEVLLSAEMPYAVRYAAAVTRGLRPPEPTREDVPEHLKRGAHAPWAPTEDAMLRDTYSMHLRNRSLHVLEQRLKRTRQAIYERANKLGLTTPAGAGNRNAAAKPGTPRTPPTGDPA